MNRIIVALLLLALLTSCGPKPQLEPTEESGPRVTISDLAVETDDREMTISWKKQGSGTISGYNIFITEQPVSTAGAPNVAAPFNPSPFPGDTDPDDGIEHFVATGMDNGKKYAVSVRVLFPDGSMSPPGPELIAVCGPKGEIELAVRYKGDQDGFSFETKEYVKANSTDNDLYFFTQEGADYLVSPARLDGFINNTLFVVLPFKGGYDSVSRQLMSTKITPTDDRVEVRKGDWVLAKTARGTNALLHVLSFQGDEEERRMKLFYAYSALVGEVFF